MWGLIQNRATAAGDTRSSRCCMQITETITVNTFSWKDNYPCYMSNPFFKRITVIRICFLKTFLPAAVTWANIVVTMVSWWRHRYSLDLVWIKDRTNRTLVDVWVITCFLGFSVTVSRETASQVIYLTSITPCGRWTSERKRGVVE